jgi:Domain of unknown function (DUF4386)
MTNRATKISPVIRARIAGALYLLTIIFGVFAEVFVRSGLIVPGDAATTASNIRASEWLFRTGFMSDLLMMACYLMLAFTLYIVFKPANNNLSLLFVLFTLASVAIMCLNMLNQFAALLLLSGANYLAVFNTEQLQALAMLFLDLQKYGYFIAQIFFGLWLLPLGYVGFKSSYFPRVLGILVILAGVGHLIQFFQVFLFPGYDVITYPGLAIATLGEFVLCFWLLIKGVNVPQMEARTLEPA